MMEIILNMHGMVQNVPKLIHFIKLCNINIILILETHFNSRSFLKIHNYSIYDTEHPDRTPHEGAPLLLSKTLGKVVKYQTSHITSRDRMFDDGSKFFR